MTKNEGQASGTGESVYKMRKAGLLVVCFLCSSWWESRRNAIPIFILLDPIRSVSKQLQMFSVRAKAGPVKESGLTSRHRRRLPSHRLHH